ncbi:MAG: hypothetical protein DWP95_11670 [Proteobacteria bacterium]|nr:MAG: hypothetical protein DWP95_11670 [Pseudomonadota bacterium]
MSNKNHLSAINTLSLWRFVNSISFSRAIRVTIAVSLPILLGLQFGYVEIGLALGFGAFWSSPSDVSGSIRHKENGILISALLATIVSFIGASLHYETWFTLPVLGVLSFGIAFLTVFGFRASLISLSGLLALAVSLALEPKTLQIYQFALLIGLGGLWYLLLTHIWHRINSKEETEEFLTETYLLTAEFLEIRGKLIDPKEDQDKLQSQLLYLQRKLTENHETLREILILTRKNSGWSNYQNKRLLIFAQLIAMLETAIANPVDYDRMNRLFNEHPQYIKRFQALIFEMAKQLRLISEAGNDKRKLPKNDAIKQCFKDVKLDIALLRESFYYNEYFMLQNFLDYQEKQFDKLKRIKWLLGDPDTLDMEFIDRKVAERFVATPDYDPRLLLRNFSFKSTIFRHSIRLAVTVMIAYALGSLFAFQNPHWVLLAVIVIMRPGYGLTKNRAKDRLIGTLIGGVIATVLVLLIHNPILYGAMGLISMVIALALLQKNNQVSAMFITLTIAFIYAILQPDILNLIKFRMFDTFLGAGLSYAAILWLWPSWEFVEIKDHIKKSITANMNFLNKISEYYLHKGTLKTSYNIARKEAFLETSNLSSAYQRMTQEPKSKQRETDKIYELVVLNHTLLTALASLSTYIRNHETGEATEQYNVATEKIVNNLTHILQHLKNDNKIDKQDLSKDTALFDEQLPSFNSFDQDHFESKDEDSVRELQEAQLLWQQLQWLYSISGKMFILAASVHWD